MQGKVLFYDVDKTQGLISAEDGKRYSFTKEDLRGQSTVSQGIEVDFISEDGESAADIYVLNSTTVQQSHQSNGPWAEYVPCKPGNIFSWNGCYSRSRWWMVMISLFFFGIILWVVEYMFVIQGYSSMASNLMHSNFTAEIGRRGLKPMITMGIFIVWLMMVWIGIMASVKRFHDANMSGWMWFLNFIPFIGAFIVFVINGFVGSKRIGNIYCAAKDLNGMPIIKGSQAALEYEMKSS